MSRTEDIRSLSYEELCGELTALGEKAFRGGQVYGWLHQKLADSPGEMTDIPRKLRGWLGENYSWANLEKVDMLESREDGTRKYLFRLTDGNVIESVLMKYRHGNSVCISSQVGCRMGCRFCASTLGGLTRNLLPGEMLGQVYQIQKDIGERISHIVVMGTGEPLDNYENLVKFIRMASDAHGLHISQRNITVSTCGIVPGIYRLAQEDLQITLALSLHASTQEKREKLMPIARKYELSEVLAACRAYFEKTSRRMTFEYSLVGHVNDSLADARGIRDLLCGMNCHINLIPVNPIRERDFRQSDRRVIEAFRAELERYGFNVTIRREMGRDINGACGQLRKDYMERQ